jgi:hypothetical protein
LGTGANQAKRQWLKMGALIPLRLLDNFVARPDALQKVKNSGLSVSVLLKGTSINSKFEDIEDNVPRGSDAVFSGQAIFRGPLENLRANPILRPKRIGWPIYLILALVTTCTIGVLYQQHQAEIDKEHQLQETDKNFQQQLEVIRDGKSLFSEKKYDQVLNINSVQDERLLRVLKIFQKKAEIENKNASQQLKQAQDTVKKGDMSKAIEQLKKVPNHTRAYSKAQRELQAIDAKAKENLNKAQELDRAC